MLFLSCKVNDLIDFINDKLFELSFACVLIFLTSYNAYVLYSIVPCNEVLILGCGSILLICMLFYALIFD